MKKLFKGWTFFEIGLLVFDVMVILISAMIGKSGILIILTSLVGVICVLLQAKGKMLSQFVGIIEVILYSILSYPIKTNIMEKLLFMYWLCFQCIFMVCFLG